VRSDEERFRDGETLNQIDGVGSWVGTYDPVDFGERDVDDDEWCPDCRGEGIEDYGATCMTCGGTGWLAAS
jgi:RecJ-like exonuclease